ncbi:hypothetical protein OFM39_33270, partial [Escherichia coli]|nr:hypothetical protein [Escherichia coli]
MKANNENHNHEPRSGSNDSEQTIIFHDSLRKAAKYTQKRPNKVLIKSLDGQSTSKLEINDMKHSKRNV